MTVPATSAAILALDAAEPGRRPRWWPEVLAIVWLAWAYDAIANLAPVRTGPAYRHARSILHLEHLAGADPEAALNKWLAGHHTLAVWLSNYYDNAHFVVTFAVIGWLWWRHPGRYRPLRTSLILINVIGMAVFWLYPTAPPRLLDPHRYVDVVAATHAFGSWHSGTLATAANQLAAMPSLHLAWAVWSSLAFWRVFRPHWWAWLAWLYPVATTVAVMATGNHFLLDAVAGVATMALATVVADRWQGWWTARQARQALEPGRQGREGRARPEGFTGCPPQRSPGVNPSG